MQANLHPWEHSLLNLAYEAHRAHGPGVQVQVDQELLEAAYGYCAEVTRNNSRSFHLASAFLPQEKRRAVRALYAFCRVTDDIVDHAQGDSGLEMLEAWRKRLSAATPPSDDLVALAWADARARYGVPWRLGEQLIDGVARDTVQNRYDSFEELAAYSYGVASTVGLMSMHVIGFSGPQAIPHAIKLGVALQLTNILRDVAEDFRNGRIYLPRDEMGAFGVTEEMIGEGIVTPEWREFMRFQIDRNRRLYAEAAPGISMLARDGRLAIAAASDLYRGILTEIERMDYNNLNRRAHVSGARKLRLLPRSWWRSRR